MDTTCPHCHTPNASQGRFCSNCGKILAATADSPQTLVMQPTQAHQPSVDVQTIIQRTQQAFGNGPVAAPTRVNPATNLGQREHIVFAIDVSGSMASRYDSRMSKLEAAVRANCTMVVEKQQIDPLDEIAIVSFCHKAQTHLTLCSIQTHKRQILTTLQSLRSHGGTDINEALKQAEQLFDWSHSDVVRRIVLLTDGHGGHPQRTAERLKSRGVVIDIVGVGAKPSGVNESMLKQIASVIEGELRYRFIKDQQTLIAHYTQLAGKTATA